MVKVSMGGNGLRKGAGKGLVLAPRLEPLTIGHLVDVYFRVIVILGHGVPNISLMRSS